MDVHKRAVDGRRDTLSRRGLWVIFRNVKNTRWSWTSVMIVRQRVFYLAKSTAANADVGLQSRTNENVDYCTLWDNVERLEVGTAVDRQTASVPSAGRQQLWVLSWNTPLSSCQAVVRRRRREEDGERTSGWDNRGCTERWNLDTDRRRTAIDISHITTCTVVAVNCCVFTRATPCGPCVCLSPVGVLLKRLNEPRWVLARELRPTVYCVLRNFGYLQNKALPARICSKVMKFRHGISIIEMWLQLSTRKVDGQRMINWTVVGQLIT